MHSLLCTAATWIVGDRWWIVASYCVLLGYNLKCITKLEISCASSFIWWIFLHMMYSVGLSILFLFRRNISRSWWRLANNKSCKPSMPTSLRRCVPLYHDNWRFQWQQLRFCPQILIPFLKNVCTHFAQNCGQGWDGGIIWYICSHCLVFMHVSLQDLSAERGRLQAQAEKQVHEVEQRCGDEMKRKVTYQL